MKAELVVCAFSPVPGQKVWRPETLATFFVYLLMAQPLILSRAVSPEKMHAFIRLLHHGSSELASACVWVNSNPNHYRTPRYRAWCCRNIALPSILNHQTRTNIAVTATYYEQV